VVKRRKRRGRGQAVTAVAVLLALLALVVAVKWFGSFGFGREDTAAALMILRPEGAEPHPVLGHRFPPNSETYSRYPTNPREYFEPDSGDLEWILAPMEGSSARLDRGETQPGRDHLAVREIGVASKVDWQVQLHVDKLSLQKKAPYLLRFRARALSPRPLSFLVAQAHPPWRNLGLYQRVTLTPFWQSFEAGFAAPASEQNARIQFNVGGSETEVEIEDVRLLRGDTMESVVPARGFVVRYRFDRFGCRGVDRAIPPGPGSFRILVLGGSETLGVGVHESDTFSSVLERMLNATTDVRRDALAFEVVNCGVDRYDARQARLFYELVTAEYQPHLVLLAVAPTPAGEEQERRALDPAAIVEEVLALGRSTRERGARLGVVALRTRPLEHSPEWTGLLEALPGRLEESGVPFRDLGLELLEKHQPAELRVYADLDPHPNEMAHRLAAEEILDFLLVESLLAETKADETKVAAGASP
jgi:hypothetical protein